MTRFICSFALLFSILASLGCRMCGSPYDYCMPTYLDRTDDYRGCDPLYRSGSIFRQGDCYLGYGDDETLGADRAANAGNFGVTTPIDSRTGRPTLGPQRQGGSPIGKPKQEPLANGNGFDTPTQSVEELLRENRPGMPSPLTPTPLDNVVPPGQPAPIIPGNMPEQPIPFTMSGGNEPTITLEDLQRLDPSVTDIKILNIDDALDTASPSGHQQR